MVALVLDLCVGVGLGLCLGPGLRAPATKNVPFSLEIRKLYFGRVLKTSSTVATYGAMDIRVE